VSCNLTTNDLTTLRHFDSKGHLTLSVYLDLSTPEKKTGVVARVTDQVNSFLHEHTEIEEAQLAELQEDLDMVRLYFTAKGSCQPPYLAIFSCAPQLFWRALRLESPVEEQVHIGPQFDIEPLTHAISPIRNAQRELKSDLLVQSKYASL